MSVYVYTSIALNSFSKARVLSTMLKKFSYLAWYNAHIVIGAPTEHNTQLEAQELQLVLNSSISCKITKPLRAIVKLARKFMR